MLNNVFPLRLGDVARVTMVSKGSDLRLGHAVSSLFTERVADTVVLVLCVIAVSPFLKPSPEHRADLVNITLIAAGVVVGLAVLAGVLFLLRRQLRALGSFLAVPRRALDWVGEEAASFRQGLAQLVSRQRAKAIWGWSAVAWVGAFAINVLLMEALDIDAPLATAVLITCTTNIAMMIPSSPGYVGVFHAVATATLLPFGVGAEEALSFAILAHAVNVIPPSFIGAVFAISGGSEALGSVRPTWRRAQAADPDQPLAEVTTR
jgi:hypothetical protein